MFIHVFRQNRLMNNKMVIWFVYDNADLMTKTEDFVKFIRQKMLLAIRF